MTAVRQGYEGSDADQLEEHLARFDMHVRARPLPGRGTMSAHSLVARASGVRSWDGEHRAGVVFTAERPFDAFMVHAPVDGAMEMRIGSARHGAMPGHLLVARGMDLDELRFGVETRHQGLSVDRSVVVDRLAVLLDRPVGEDLVFHPVSETQGGGPAVLMAIIGGLLQATLRGGLQADSAAVGGLAGVVPTLLLECIPNTYSQILRNPPPKLAPRQVKRALALIHEDPKSPLNMDEVARLSGVSVRSLQYAFRDFVGMSPGEYRRRRRLELAAAEIKARDGRRPAEIAADWGFENITRFRALCRKLQVELTDF